MEKYVLVTKRLILRPFEAGDVEDSLEYRNDPEFGRYLPQIPFPYTRKDAEEFVRVNMTEPWETSPTFAVVFEGKVIGTVNMEIGRRPGHADDSCPICLPCHPWSGSGEAMVGYAIGRRYWGRGIAVEAIQAVLVWAFTRHGLRRIWASTHLENKRSKRVLGKLGFRLWKVEGEAYYELTPDPDLNDFQGL